MKDCFGFAKFRYEGIGGNDVFKTILQAYGGKLTVFGDVLYIFKNKDLHITGRIGGHSITVTYKFPKKNRELIEDFEGFLHRFLEE